MFERIPVRVSQLNLEQETTYDDDFKVTKREVVKVTLARDGKGPAAITMLSIPTSEFNPFVLGARLEIGFEPRLVDVLARELTEDQIASAESELVAAMDRPDHGLGAVETETPAVSEPALASAGEGDF